MAEGVQRSSQIGLAFPHRGTNGPACRICKRRVPAACVCHACGCARRYGPAEARPYPALRGAAGAGAYRPPLLVDRRWLATGSEMSVHAAVAAWGISKAIAKQWAELSDAVSTIACHHLVDTTHSD